MNSACNCCQIPPPVRIVLQFASFDRACSNTCILRYGDPGTPPTGDSFANPWDWLTGPFLTSLSAFASDTKTFSDEGDNYSYTSKWNRTTTAMLQLNDSNRGNTGPYDCPCTHEYSDNQSSSSLQIIEGEDQDGRAWRIETAMECNGGGTGKADGSGGNFNGGGGEFGGGGASGSWGSGTNNANYSDLPSEISGYVNGGSPYLTQQQITNLVNTLVAYEEQTGNQLIVVFTSNNPNGTYDPFALAQQYRVGQGNGVNNGIVIFVHPNSNNWQVAVGYGLEGDIPDIIANEIMTNAFGSNASSNIYESLTSAVEGFTGISTPNSPNGGQGTGETQKGRNCALECPPYLDPVMTAAFGAAGEAKITYTSIDTQIPYNEDSNYVETVTCDCENPCSCPVPYPFPQNNGYIEPTSEFLGNSAQCKFTENDEFINFPLFPTIIKLTPYAIFNSGFETIPSPFLNENQGYASTTFRYARGRQGRYMQQSEQHVKWRIAHNPTPTCYLKVWFVKKKTVIKKDFPDKYVPPIITWEDAGFYEWDGTGKTCLNFGQKSIYDIDNIIYGGENVMNLPQPNVEDREYGIEEEIFIKKISVIKDYEPPNPPSNSTPPELAQYGFAAHDVSINRLDCEQCGLAKSQGGGGAEAWWCAYKFLPLPDGCVTV